VAAACNDSHDGGSSASTTPPATSGSTTNGSTSMALDTAQVLALAQTSSETSQPFAVVGGALTLTDTSDTSTPIYVMAMMAQ
jgi:hypothetical protein